MRWTEPKYHNRKVTVDGLTFDSLKEASRYEELKLLVRAGEIKDLKRQVPIEIVPKTDKFRAVRYVADFTYTLTRNGQPVVEDVKGYKGNTAAYRMFTLKKKLVYWIYGIEIKEV